MAITVSDQKCEWREVLLRDKPSAMIDASAKGTVPVLVLQNGAVIDESLSVMDWALSSNDPQHWLVGYDTEQKALVETCDGSFKFHLDRYKYSTRYNDADRLAHRTEASKFVSILDDILRIQPFLHGARAGYSDYAIFPFIRQFRIADPDWFDNSQYSDVIAWLTKCVSFAVFQRSMAKRAPWRPNHPIDLFPPSQ